MPGTSIGADGNGAHVAVTVSDKPETWMYGEMQTKAIYSTDKQTHQER